MRYLIPLAALAVAGCGLTAADIDRAADAIDEAQAEGVDIYDLTEKQRETYRWGCTLGPIFWPLIESTTTIDFGALSEAGCRAIAAFDEEPGE